MNGLECLREEMKKRGCNKAQIESSTAAIVLDIVANTGNDYTNARELEMKLEIRENRLANKERSIARREEVIAEKEKNISKYLDEKIKGTIDYIQSFMDALEKCETPEGRDAMKRAQLFINTVSIETSQNNTAFIEGLSRILSFGVFDVPQKLEKVDKDAVVEEMKSADMAFKYPGRYVQKGMRL